MVSVVSEKVWNEKVWYLLYQRRYGVNRVFIVSEKAWSEQ